MATAKGKVREAYPKAHATKHIRQGVKTVYWLVWDARIDGKRIGTGTTEGEAWKDALTKCKARQCAPQSPQE